MLAEYAEVAPLCQIQNAIQWAPPPCGHALQHGGNDASLFFRRSSTAPLIYQAASYLRLSRGGPPAVSRAGLFLAHGGPDETGGSFQTRTRLFQAVLDLQSIRGHVMEEAGVAGWRLRLQSAETKGEQSCYGGRRSDLPSRRWQCDVPASMSGTCRQAMRRGVTLKDIRVSCNRAPKAAAAPRTEHRLLRDPCSNRKCVYLRLRALKSPHFCTRSESRMLAPSQARVHPASHSARVPGNISVLHSPGAGGSRHPLKRGDGVMSQKRN